MSDKKGVIAGKILPKARPLMPGEEERDAALVQTFNTNGLSPYIDPEDPDVKAAQNDYEAAQKKLRHTIQRKAMLKLVQDTGALDPDKVEELCANEPWKKGSLEQINKGLLGFVPEKFAAAAQMHPEGSPEHLRLNEAAERAANIYWDQMKVALRQTCAKFDNDPAITKKRTAYEPLSASLGGFAKSLEGQPLFDEQRGRIMWMALNLGEEYMNKYGSKGGSGPGYQQWSLKLEEPA